MNKTVIELFAGVGGFRVGLNKIKKLDQEGRAIENGPFQFVWANQWEPSTKIQHAFDCYNTRFSESNNSNQDISLVDKKAIATHSLLCGGFPCQDYSVARSLSKEKGIEGKKGVLWWQINLILKEKQTPFLLLENVDRLLKSPSKQRGRDFGIMLKCLDDLGYAVEWRVINAAEYGHPQRRRRTYIFAYRNTTHYYFENRKNNPLDVINEKGLFAKEFPVVPQDEEIKPILISGFSDLVELSNTFKASLGNAGYMIKGKIYTTKVEPANPSFIPLSKIAQKNVDEHYFLNISQERKFEILRKSKKIPRKAPNGETYFYSEGSMSPFDSFDFPGRTMLTSEGSINRSTHIVKDRGRLRLLTPIECERLNQFPDNWTNTMPEKRRYFMMGNALVCGVIEKIGNQLSRIIDNEE